MKEQIKKVVSVFIIIALVPLSAFIFGTGTGFSVYDSASKTKRNLGEREYVVGALCACLPPDTHPQALRAAAVAIYTNAVRSRASGEKYVITANPEKMLGYANKKAIREHYGKNYDLYYKRMCDAVDDTLKKVITYDGKPILAAYHYCSAGKTESCENALGQALPYLVPTDSEGDTFCPTAESKKEFSAAEVRSILSASFPESAISEDDSLMLTDFMYSPSGYVLSAKVGEQSVSGANLRTLFSLPSTAFSLALSDKTAVFSVHGKGHGVGMSLYGADFMARQGAQWREILSHYYKDIVIMETE